MLPPEAQSKTPCSSQMPIDFAAAVAARDAGMAQALDHANRVVEGWGDLAYLFLEKYAKEQRRFTSYDVRMAAKSWGLIMPITDKAFGPVFLRAAKQGIIRRAGYEQHPERHASPTVLWESLV